MNGIRLARFLTPDSTISAARRAIARPQRDFRKIPPVSDAVFAAYRRYYDYDPGPLNAVAEESDSSARDWVKQRITFDAAYGHERVIAYLFLPRNAKPPFQAVAFSRETVTSSCGRAASCLACPRSTSWCRAVEP
jgi:eukaryotic-like serine/threonine-protein kinase